MSPQYSKDILVDEVSAARRSEQVPNKNRNDALDQSGSNLKTLRTASSHAEGNKINSANPLQQQVHALRTKRAQAILFSKSKKTLTKPEKEFIWTFVKQYSESHEFIMINGTTFHK
jgi:hypothetical protein